MPASSARTRRLPQADDREHEQHIDRRACTQIAIAFSTRAGQSQGRKKCQRSPEPREGVIIPRIRAKQCRPPAEVIRIRKKNVPILIQELCVEDRVRPPRHDERAMPAEKSPRAAMVAALPAIPVSPRSPAPLASRPLRALRIVFLRQLSAAGAESCRVDQSQLVRAKAERRRQNSEPVLHAAFEVD